MSRPVVYISGPITKGDRNLNYHQFCVAHRDLMDNGFSPLNPGLTMQLPFAWEAAYPHEVWMACNYPLVEKCDALLRLPGESIGADMEVKHARRYSKPVFHSIEELIKWRTQAA